MTIEQIKKYRIIHEIILLIGILAFSISVALIIHMTQESVLVGLEFMAVAIVLKLFESQVKAKLKKLFDAGLEEVLKKHFEENNYSHSVKLRKRGKNCFKYYVDFYETVDTDSLKKVIKKYAKENEIKIKFELRELNFLDEIFG